MIRLGIISRKDFLTIHQASLEDPLLNSCLFYCPLSTFSSSTISILMEQPETNPVAEKSPNIFYVKMRTSIIGMSLKSLLREPLLRDLIVGILQNQGSCS